MTRALTKDALAACVVGAVAMVSTAGMAQVAVEAGPPVYGGGVYGGPYGAYDPRDYRPGWYRRWQLRRLYHNPPGYTPDHYLCFPGACRDNPYY